MGNNLKINFYFIGKASTFCLPSFSITVRQPLQTFILSQEKTNTGTSDFLKALWRSEKDVKLW